MIEPYTDDDAIRDLAKIVAQTASGGRGAEPESSDESFAKNLLSRIERYHNFDDSSLEFMCD